MKLASLNDGSKDGQLIVVSRDLSKFAYASDVSQTMQNAMDNWEDVFNELTSLSNDLNRGNLKSKKFEPKILVPPSERADLVFLAGRLSS